MKAEKQIDRRLNQTELADFLGKNVATIRTWTRKGLLKSIGTVNGQCLYSLADAKRCVQQNALRVTLVTGDWPDGI